MWLANKFGRVYYIGDKEEAEMLLKKPTIRRATPDEIEVHERTTQTKAIETAESAGKSIFYQTVRNSPDGYGMSRDLLKKELFRQGVLLSENMIGQKIGMIYNYPYPITQLHNDVRLIYTMFESDQIPEDWPELLHEADEVLVPSKWCKEVFAKRGVETTVVPLGYNDDAFSYIERDLPLRTGQPFTFIHYNSFNIRKGFIEVFNAFTEEFGPEENVKLILKTTHEKPPIPVIPSQYPNVEVISGTLPESGLYDLLKRAHCMVYPSRGEGFGITPLEAMATGLPAIVPNAHGISEYFDKDYMLEVKVEELTPALYNKFKDQDVGSMVLCDTDDLRKQMRYAFNHQQEMHNLGEKASEYVKQFTYKETAKKLKEVFARWEKMNVPRRADAEYLEAEEV